MNKYIKFKKRYPAIRDWSVAEIRVIATKSLEKGDLWTSWHKNGKVNFINALRAQRMVDRGEYYYGPVGSMRRGKDRRRTNLENAWRKMCRFKPPILKGGVFNKKATLSATNAAAMTLSSFIAAMVVISSTINMSARTAAMAYIS